MNDLTIKRIDEIDPYRGPDTVAGIQFRPAGRALGVAAFGLNVLTLAPGATGYPEHDHAKEGQEEVYVLLDGSATLRADGRDWPLERGVLVRVGPAVRRKWTPGPGGATILALGGTPGKAYEPRR